MGNSPRPIQELDKEACIAELTEAKAAGVDVPEFSDEMGVTALRKLVKEARTAVPTEETPEPPKEPEETPEAPEQPKQPATVPDVAVSDFSGPVTVICKNGKPSRVYSRQEHGAQYLTLAKNYAEANDGTLL